MKRLVTGCYAALLVLSAALPAVASQPVPPRYQSSEPGDGETVHRPPDRVEVTFDQPLDGSSELAVGNDCGKNVDDGDTEVDGNTMSIGLSSKPSGDYHVEYVAVGIGGITGKSTGHFTFTAHGGKACDGDGSKHDHDGNDKNGHNGHDDDHGKQPEGEGHAAGSGDHDADGSTGGASHSDHDGGAGETHGTHEGDNGNDHAAGHGGSEESGAVPGITSADDTSRKLLSRADSGTLLLSLGLCALLGILGGAVLRASGAR